MKTQLKLPQDGVISKWNFFEVQNEVDPFQLQLRDWAKVRFECIKCGNGWTSMRGLIRFQIQIQNLFMPDRVKRCFMVITNKKIFRFATWEIFLHKCLGKNVKGAWTKDSKIQCGIRKKLQRYR